MTEESYKPDRRTIGTVIAIVAPLVITGVGTALWIKEQFDRIDADVKTLERQIATGFDSVERQIAAGFAETEAMVEGEFKAGARQDSLETSAMNQILGEILGHVSSPPVAGE